jgi:hypothetical protein
MGQPTQLMGQPTQLMGQPTQLMGQPTQLMGRFEGHDGFNTLDHPPPAEETAAP